MTGQPNVTAPKAAKAGLRINISRGAVAAAGMSAALLIANTVVKRLGRGNSNRGAGTYPSRVGGARRIRGV